VEATEPTTSPTRGPLITRRRLEIALGLLWLLDGALQFQPYMFSDAFFKDILGMANMGLPGPVGSLDYHVAKMLSAHPVAWNATFASFQVGLGLGLLWRRTANLARGASIGWALGVWIIGEGFGGMFMSGTSLVTGAPGAALLYAVAAVLLWPSSRNDGPAVADSGPLGPRLSKWVWTALWTGAALLELEAVNHARAVPSAQLANGADGEPQGLAALNTAAGHLVAGHGAVFAALVGLTAVTVGWGVLWTAARRATLGAASIAAVAFWIVGQDLGAVMTGQGTDPGTGPLLVLLALTLWPRRVGSEPSPSSLHSSRSRGQPLAGTTVVVPAVNYDGNLVRTAHHSSSSLRSQ
jgi:hypothetical protein